MAGAATGARGPRCRQPPRSPPRSGRGHGPTLENGRWRGQPGSPPGRFGPPARPTGDGYVKLSARNKLDGTITGITKGDAIANVALDVAGQRLVASITVEALDELGLAEGSSVT